MEQSGTEKNLFEVLKEIRIQKEIRLEDIADTSKIQLKYLSALEEGDLREIPEVYDKLFFRSYLKAIGASEEDYFDQFLEYRKKTRIDKTTTTIEFSPGKDDISRKIFSHKNFFLVLPVVLIILVIAILLINTENIGTASEGKVQEIDIKNVVQRMKEEHQARLDSIELAKQIADSSGQQMSKYLGLSLNINAQKTTWFRVVCDKSDTLEYLLQAGQNINITAKSIFEFLIGRADGLVLRLNNKKLERAGPDSTVVRYMLIDSTGIVIKRLKTVITAAETGEISEPI